MLTIKPHSKAMPSSAASPWEIEEVPHDGPLNPTLDRKGLFLTMQAQLISVTGVMLLLDNSRQRSSLSQVSLKG
jgi:hypothetical protein